MNKDLNHFFQKPLHACGIIGVAILLSGFGPAELSDESVEELFFETITPDRSRRALTLAVFRSNNEDRRIWNVLVAPEGSPEDALCRTPLPLEAGEDGYEVTLESASDPQSRVLLLLTARQTRQRQMDPATHQLALQIEPHPGPARWRCSVIARGEHSTLDGGVRLFLDKDQAPPVLIRRDDEAQPRFCGLQPDERPGDERFDPSSGRFLPGADLDLILEETLPLTATLPQHPLPPPLTDRFYTWTIASSDVRGAPVGANPPRPLMLGDLDSETAWIDGGEGTGEFVTASITPAVPVDRIRLFPGHSRDEELFQNFGRPTQVVLAFSTGDRFRVDLPSHSFLDLTDAGGLLVTLPDPIYTRCLTTFITARQVGDYAHSADPDRRRAGRAVAIGEITPYSTIDAHTEQATAERIIKVLIDESSPAKRDQIARLAALIPNALAASIDEVLNREEASLRRQLIPVLNQLPHTNALPILKNHLLRISPEAADYRATKRAIATFSSHSAPILLELLESIAPDEPMYIDVLRLLGRVGTTVHLLPLTNDLGEGPERVRRERSRSLAAGGLPLVPRLLNIVNHHVDDPAGIDALTTLIFIGQRHFHDRASTISGQALANAFEGSSMREFRIRLLIAMSYYQFESADEFLAEVLTNDPDPVLRQFAAQSLRLYEHDSALELLVQGLDDTSPDVRIASVRALNHRRDGVNKASTVLTYLHDETWPQAIRQGLQLVVRSVDEETRTALHQFIQTRIQEPVAIMALRAMRRNQQALPLTTIDALLRANDTPHNVRRQLVDMLASSSSVLAEDLLNSLAEKTYEPLMHTTPEVRDDLALRAILAMGQRNTQAMGDHLLVILQDATRPPDERLIALRSLGFVNDEEIFATLQRIATELPAEFRTQYRQTLGLMQGRLAIDDTNQDIEAIRRSLETENLPEDTD